MTGGTAATAGVAEKTAAVFALAGAEGAGGPVNEGYCGGGDKNDGGCGLSKDTARSHGDESTVGGAGEVAALRERAAAAAAAAEAAAKEKQRLKDEIEAIKERLASAEEQLRCARVHAWITTTAISLCDETWKNRAKGAQTSLHLS